MGCGASTEQRNHQSADYTAGGIADYEADAPKAPEYAAAEEEYKAKEPDSPPAKEYKEAEAEYKAEEPAADYQAEEAAADYGAEPKADYQAEEPAADYQAEAPPAEEYKEAEAAPAEEYKVEDVTPEDYKEPEAAPAEEVAADYKTEDYKAEEAAVPEDYKEAEAPKEAEPAAEHKEADDTEGASHTYPMQAGSIRKGDHCMLKGNPCKVSHVARDEFIQQNVEYGRAMCNFTGNDIFTNKKYEDKCPESHLLAVPHVVRAEYQLLHINTEDGTFSLGTDSGDIKDDLNLPAGTDGQYEEIVGQIEEEFYHGKKLVIIVLMACGKEKVVEMRELK